MMPSPIIFPPPSGMAGVKKTFGDFFKWTELSKGAVLLDSGWMADNLVIVRNVLGTGLTIQLHRLVVPVFELALSNARAACPKYKVKQLAGFCARHKMGDPKRELSLHSWAIALDINWATNGVGKKAPHDLPEPFVEAFEEQGWQWGGKWSSPDYMHFQFATNC